MRFLIDTNILLHAANRASDLHPPARKFLEGHLRARTAWCTTWPILYEFLRVSTHRRVFPKPLTAREAIQFISCFVGFEQVVILGATESHLGALQQVTESLGGPAGNIFHDIHTAVLMQEHGIPEIVTDDSDFLRFPFLRVSNPLRQST